MSHDGNDFSELLDELDMEDYLNREAIEYRHRHGSSGPQLNIRTCPACGDDRWKVYLNADTGLGNCFHGDCHQGTFNKWSFIKAHIGADDNRAVSDHVRRVAAEFGWRPKRKERLPKPLGVSLGERPGERQLPSNTIMLPDQNGANLAYLEERGITSALAAEFGLGYCHEGRYRYQENGEERWQDYRQRVIIPVFDLEGQMVTFQGRDITGNANPKYKFPPALAASGAYLYHGNRAVGATEAVLCEGVFDVMSVRAAFQSDDDLYDVATLGSFGMHLSQAQIDAFRVLKQHGLKRVVIMWDGEPRAVKKARDAAENLIGIGLEARVALLNEKDPNESTPEAIKVAFYNAANPLKGAGLQAIIRKSLGA